MAPPGAIERCLDVLARNAKSFHFASQVLPRCCRAETAVLYAWCRLADDAIDLAPSDQVRPNLARLERELDDIYAGRPQSDLVLAAFQEVVKRRSIPRSYPAELLAGFAMDLDKDRYASLDELFPYCFRVAGAVGLMMCHVLRVSNEKALRHAAHLGMAMQLTNICRDVREDWQRGRLYLPLDLLARAGAPGLDRHLGGELPASAHGAVATVVHRLLDEADVLYRSADRGLRAMSTRCLFAVRTARLVYAAIGDRIAARGYDAWAGRAYVPFARKLLLLAKAAGGFGVDVFRRLGKRFTPIPPRAVLKFPDDIFPV